MEFIKEGFNPFTDSPFGSIESCSFWGDSILNPTIRWHNGHHYECLTWNPLASLGMRPLSILKLNAWCQCEVLKVHNLMPFLNLGNAILCSMDFFNSVSSRFNFEEIKQRMAMFFMFTVGNIIIVVLGMVHFHIMFSFVFHPKMLTLHADCSDFLFAIPCKV